MSWGNIQFVHHNPDNFDYDSYRPSTKKAPFKGTLAVEVPEREMFMNCVMAFMAGHEVFRDFKVGRSKVHPNDNYVKKVGREIASKRLEDEMYLLEQCFIKNDGVYLKFTRPENDLYFKMSHKSIKVYLLRAYGLIRF